MPEYPLEELRTALIASGMPPRTVSRMIRELADHVDEVEAEALAAGMPPAQAAAYAFERIGSARVIAEHAGYYPALRGWMHRYPRLARVYCPLAYVLLLPAAPIFAGFAYPGVVLRWLAAFALSAGVTAGMLLFLQIVIATT